MKTLQVLKCSLTSQEKPSAMTMSSLHRPSRILGFTLVELMVTIAVVAIIAMMAAPSFSNMIAKQKLNSDLNDLSSTMAHARTQAALLRRDVTVTLGTTGTNTDVQFFWIANTNNRLTTTTTSVVFQSDGTVNNIDTNTDFTICNSTINRSKTVTLTRMGVQYSQGEGTC